MWISPILTMGTAARGFRGGSIGLVTTGAVVVVVTSAAVVVVVGSASSTGASFSEAEPGEELTTARVEPPTTRTAVRVAITSALSARLSGRRAVSQPNGRKRRRTGADAS